MLTATDDLLLPATVTGSWPRPAWFTENLSGRPLDRAMLELSYREQFGDALAAVVSDQERAGLDIVTNGDYYQDQDVAGYSWMHYVLERWKGFDPAGEARRPSTPHAPGTLLHDVNTSWRWPTVVGAVSEDPTKPLGFGEVHRTAQQRASHPVKFGTASPQCISKYLDIAEGAPARYGPDKRALITDMTTALNAELRRLRDAGCRVIQIEEPLIHLSAVAGADQETIDFLVDAWNQGLEGLDDVEIWIHTCWGSPNMQRIVDKPSYARSIEIYLERMRGDVWTVESKEGGFAELELFAPWRGRLPKKVAVGVVSHRSLQVESPAEVAAGIRRALEYIDAESLVLSSDCGFGRQGCDRAIATYKAAAIALGRNIVLEELGQPPRPVPLAMTDEQRRRAFRPEAHLASAGVSR